MSAASAKRPRYRARRPELGEGLMPVSSASVPASAAPRPAGTAAARRARRASRPPPRLVEYSNAVRAAAPERHGAAAGARRPVGGLDGPAAAAASTGMSRSCSRRARSVIAASRRRRPRASRTSATTPGPGPPGMGRPEQHGGPRCVRSGRDVQRLRRRPHRARETRAPHLTRSCRRLTGARGLAGTSAPTRRRPASGASRPSF